MRVLIVDDDEVLRQLLGRWLKKLGHTPRGASSAKGATEIVDAFRPNVIIVAMDLPDRSGLGLVRQLRRTAPDCGFIMSGEDPSVRDLLDLMHLGVLDFLELPVSQLALTIAIDRGRHGGSALVPEPAATAPEEARRRAPGSPPGAGDTLTRLLSTGLIRLIKEGRVEVPVIAPMARDIQRLLAQPTCGSAEILQIVGQDPAVVRAVLRTASSSYYQGVSRAFGLEEACNRLGNRRVLGIAQQVIVGDLFQFEEGEMKEIVLETWRNLIVTANGARVLAGDVGHPDPEAVYIAALFHNIGEIVLLRIIGGRLEGSTLGEGVASRVGGQLMLQHESVGRMVIEKWGMPPDLVRLAGTHHLAPRAAPSHRSKVSTAQLCMAAWTVAIDCGYTYIGAAGNVDPAPWVELLGLELSEAKRLFSDAPKWVEQAGKR